MDGRLMRALAPSGNSPSLVEFRAGRMILDGTTLRADTRKGLVRIVQMEDTLLHFQWLSRPSMEVEEDQIIFPQEATFDTVSAGPARVFLLKFKEDDRKLFFWMQEPDSSKDDDIRRLVQTVLNRREWEEDEEMLGMQMTDGTEASSDMDRGQDSHQAPGSGPVNEANSLAQPPASAPGGLAHRGPQATAGISTDQARDQMAQLQSILSGLGQIQVPKAGPTLVDMFKPENVSMVLPLLQTPEVQERLAPHLPEGQKSPEAVSEIIQSPQFQQQLQSFTQVLQSQTIDLRQFGIDAARYGASVESFLQAIQDQASAQKSVVGASGEGGLGSAGREGQPPNDKGKGSDSLGGAEGGGKQS